MRLSDARAGCSSGHAPFRSSGRASQLRTPDAAFTGVLRSLSRCRGKTTKAPVDGPPLCRHLQSSEGQVAAFAATRARCLSCSQHAAAGRSLDSARENRRCLVLRTIVDGTEHKARSDLIKASELLA